MKGNPHCYMDVEVDGRFVGRLEFELFRRDVPRTVENFRCLCTGEKGVGRDTGVELAGPRMIITRETRQRPNRPLGSHASSFISSRHTRHHV